jgi:hypothetical protein
VLAVARAVNLTHQSAVSRRQRAERQRVQSARRVTYIAARRARAACRANRLRRRGLIEVRSRAHELLRRDPADGSLCGYLPGACPLVFELELSLPATPASPPAYRAEPTPSRSRPPSRARRWWVRWLARSSRFLEAGQNRGYTATCQFSSVGFGQPRGCSLHRPGGPYVVLHGHHAPNDAHCR